MKRILLFLMLGYSSGTFAQEMRPLPSLFEVTGAPAANVRSSSNGGKMGVMMANPMNKEIRKVKFADLHKMAFEGKLDKASPAHFEISIPKGRGTDAIKSVLAIPKYIEVKPNGDYEYSADLVKSKSDRGHIIIIHQGGKNFGSMTFNDRTFRMESDAVEGDILIEIDKKILDSPTSCGTSNFTQNDKKTGSNKTLPDLSGLASRAAANGSCEVRVLVLFTDNAARVSNPAQLAPTFIAETNTALRNSGIAATHLNFVLAGTQRVVFNDRFSINADLVLPRAVTDTNIAALRAQNRADLVIVLTDGNYEARSELNVLLGSVLGIATLDEYSFANTGHMALVEADASGFTFAHEVGHLMGAKHDNDLRTIGNPTAGLRLPPALTESAKGKTWFIRDCFICGRRDRKSMVAHGNTIGIRTPYFSNPAVTEPRGRSATGAADRNNFAQLLRAAPVVSGYDNTPALIVGISGPGSVQLFTNYTLTAS
ncbi:MAG: M12 family metallo-peptidase, partial [Flavobacteriaceae bacterium]